MNTHLARIVTAAIVVVSLGSCQPFNLDTVLNGQDGRPLTLFVGQTIVEAGDELTVSVSGGYPPYQVAVSEGGGSIEEAGTVFLAPSEAGISVIEVTDAVGAQTSTTITITVAQTASELSIAPTSVELSPGASLGFSASGGESPYRFSVIEADSGSPSIDPESGLYIAGSTSGTDTVAVTDDEGTSVSATITILDVTDRDVDYALDAVSNDGATLAGGVLDASFSFTNNGGDDGALSVFWTAYVSTDDTLEVGTDQVIDSGSQAALASGGSSGSISVTGTWLTTPGGYYIIILLSADEDGAPADNVGASSMVTTTGGAPDDVDYIVTTVGSTGDTVAGRALAGQFEYQNSGTQAGATEVVWRAYVSDDDTLDVGDLLVDSGDEVGLAAGATSAAIPFAGVWPATPGAYRLIVDVSAADDIDPGNDVGLTPADITVTEPDINYVVNNVTNTNSPALGGSTVSETFQPQNAGTDDGAQTLFWTAFISDDATLDGGDTLIDAGSRSAIGAGTTAPAIPIDSGTWPVVAASTSFWLFVSLSASDEPGGATGNNELAATYTVDPPDVDYSVTTVTNAGTPAEVGSTITETFQIHNNGGDPGSKVIDWTAYRSADLVLDGGDTAVDSGTHGALGGGATSPPIAIGGNWGPEAGSYYLLVEVDADDDGGGSNNVGGSGAFQINAPAGQIDYIVPAVTHNFGTVSTNSPIDETFTLRNAGGADGTQIVNYEARVSVDEILDGGDAIVATGTTPLLVAGGERVNIPIEGSWPGTPGTFYLFVEVSTGDAEASTTNNTNYSGVFTVNDPPDYRVVSVAASVVSAGGNVGESLSSAGGGPQTFQINNQSASPGAQTIAWSVYISDDASLDGADPLLDGGTHPPLGGGASSGAIIFDGPLPGSYGYYYAIIQLTAGDDSDPSDNTYTSNSIAVWQTANVENDSDDDEYLSDAEDYAIKLNSGDSVTIDGLMDDTSGYWDTFAVWSGNGVGNLELSVTWTSGVDDLDLYFRDEDGVALTDSVTGDTDSEPPSPPMVIPVAPQTLYYVDLLRVFNGTGDRYLITITAP